MKNNSQQSTTILSRISSLPSLQKHKRQSSSICVNNNYNDNDNRNYSKNKKNNNSISIYINNHINNNNNLIIQTQKNLVKSSSVAKPLKRTNILERINFNQRKWLTKHGKSQQIIFDQQMLHKLREYFDDLDLDHSGSIGSDQLQEPLITLEYSQNKQNVKQLVDQLDLDGSGEVDFAEFLQIFRKIKFEKYKNNNQPSKYSYFVQLFSQKLSKKNNNNKCIKCIKSIKRVDNQNINNNHINNHRNNHINVNNTCKINKQKITFRLALSQIRRKKILEQLKQQLPLNLYYKSRIKKQKKERKFNFIKKIQNQFINTQESNQIIKKYRQLSYHRVQLGKRV